MSVMRNKAALVIAQCMVEAMLYAHMRINPVTWLTATELAGLGFEN